jgi:hypothetical protein
MLLAAANILAIEIRLLRTAQSYYFDSPADWTALLAQFQDLLNVLIQIALLFGEAGYRNFLSIVARLTGLRLPGGE